MKKITDRALYSAVVDAENKWLSLFNDDSTPKNDMIPYLIGGLDHIVVNATKKQIEFHDKGGYRNNLFLENSFAICEEGAGK